MKVRERGREGVGGGGQNNRECEKQTEEGRSHANKTRKYR